MDERISQELNTILASANYQQKVKDVKEAIEECTSNIQAVTSLSYGQAKQISYYICLTHKLNELDFMPILSLVAGSTSGKNEVMQVLMHYAHKAHWITMGDEVTKATLKDELNSSHLGTALIEEADTVPEGLLRRRPYKVSGPLSVYKPFQSSKGEVAYLPQSYNVFGATVLHRRLEFRDNAVRRRSLIVRWRHLDPEEIEECGLIFKKAKDLSYSKSMSAIADVPLPGLEGLSNSLKGIAYETLDLWQGLLQIGLLCSDFDWLNSHALPGMKVESDEIEETMDTEPSALVFRVLLSKLVDMQTIGSPKKLGPVKLVDIRKILWSEYRRNWEEKQIAGLYKGIGLKLKVSGGRTRVYPTKESLKRAAKIMGVKDEMLDSLDKWEDYGNV